MKVKLFALIITLVLISGCAFYPAGIASSATPIENPKALTHLGRSTGSSAYFSIFGVIPLGHPEYNTAIREAIAQKKGGTNLINVRAYTRTTFVFWGFKHGQNPAHKTRGYLCLHKSIGG